MKFERVLGGDIKDALDKEDYLDIYIEKCSAVYLWRRNFRPPANISSNIDLTLKWFNKLRLVSHGEIINKTLNHFIKINKIEFLPGDWSEGKQAVLNSFLSNRKQRILFCDYLCALSVFSPPLYVGETGNLVSRVKDHTNGQSKFGKMVNNSKYLDWSDLDLYFVKIGDVSIEEKALDEDNPRTMLELVATDISFAGHVSRRG